MSSLKHVAIIMDGNGRWAKRKNKPRIFGHKVGAENIKNILETAIKHKIPFLTLFAFSCENWNRPIKEINYIFRLVGERIDDELVTYFNKHGVCFKWIGFEDKMNIRLIKKIKWLVGKTIHNKKITLTIALNYGGKQDILHAAKLAKPSTTLKQFESLLLTKHTPSVDLLIRTGGEKRISNFLLWQSAYAEIIFEPVYWPAYNHQCFTNNILEYYERHRRFGNI